MSEIAVNMTGDESRLLRAFQKTAAAQDKMEEKFRKVGKTAEDTSKSVEKAGASGHKAFGPTAIGQVGSYAMGLVSVASAIDLVRQAFALHKQEQDKAHEATKKLVEEQKKLAQSVQTPEELALLNKRADQLALQYAIPREQARGVMQSAHREDIDFQSVKRMMAASPAVNPQSMMEVAGSIPDLFEHSNLSGEEAVNMTMQGARKAKLSFEDFAKVLPAASESAEQAGTTPEELMAVLATAIPRMGSPEKAAVSIKDLNKRLAASDDPRLKGKGMVEAVHSLEKDFTKDERDKFFGSDKRDVFYQMLAKNSEEIWANRRHMQGARTGTGTDWSELKMQAELAGKDPTLMRDFRYRKAEIQEEIAREQAYGEGAVTSREGTAEARSERYKKDKGPMAGMVNEAGVWTADTFSDNKQTVAKGGEWGERLLYVPLFQAIDKLFYSAQKQEEAAEKIDQSAKNLEQQTRSYSDGARREATANRE